MLPKRGYARLEQTTLGRMCRQCFPSQCAITKLVYRDWRKKSKTELNCRHTTRRKLLDTVERSPPSCHRLLGLQSPRPKSRTSYYRDIYLERTRPARL